MKYIQQTNFFCLFHLTFSSDHNKIILPILLQDLDTKELMEKCGLRGRGDINGIKQKMNEFGPKQVANAKYNSWSWTCLHYAALVGHSNIITLLIENGADLDPKDEDGETPLRIAIKNRKYSSITTLIKFGADLEKAKETIYQQWEFDESMREGKTQAAIAEGQRLAGENRKWKYK